MEPHDVHACSEKHGKNSDTSDIEKQEVLIIGSGEADRLLAVAVSKRFHSSNKHNHGIVDQPSNHSLDETVERLRNIL